MHPGKCQVYKRYWPEWCPWVWQCWCHDKGDAPSFEAALFALHDHHLNGYHLYDPAHAVS